MGAWLSLTCLWITRVYGQIKLLLHTKRKMHTPILKSLDLTMISSRIYLLLPQDREHGNFQLITVARHFFTWHQKNVVPYIDLISSLMHQTQALVKNSQHRQAPLHFVFLNLYGSGGFTKSKWWLSKCERGLCRNSSLIYNPMSHVTDSRMLWARLSNLRWTTHYGHN